MPRLMREMKQSVPNIRKAAMKKFVSPTKSSGLKQVSAKRKAAGAPTMSIFGRYAFLADASDRIEVCLPDAVAEAALLGFFFCLDGFVVRKGFHFRAVHEGCREGGISFGRDGDENGSDCISKDVHVVGMFCAAFCFFQFLYEIIAVLCRHFNVNGSDLLLSDADAGDGYVHPVEGCFFFSF